MKQRISHYESELSEFDFLRSKDSPDWRAPQKGALASVIAQWVVEPREPLLISMPTGSGKTGVATALPYLARAKRVLVVVPSKDLRDQTLEAFRSETTLRSIGAVRGELKPTVQALKGRKINWEAFDVVDVVVALPNSISPVHFTDDSRPPTDLFDLVVIDEAHHAPAKTWRAILDYFTGASAVLLTATPRRSDGKQLPGTHAFHYPLRLAMSEGIYQPIDPHLLPIEPTATLDDRDRMIAEEVVRLSTVDVHATSAILIRVSSIARAGKIQALYESLGMNPSVLHSNVPNAEREDVVKKWRSGEIRAVLTVDMLGEGIDVPNLRIVGYHDKHKSVVATMQFIGRLARSNDSYPQSSALVTALDAEVYPAIQSAVRELYAEDADWVEVLPKLIDDQVRNHKLDVEYLRSFEDSPPVLSLLSIAPLARAIIFEAREGSKFEPSFTGGGIPEELRTGSRIAGQTILYAGLNERSTTLLLLTAFLETPKWYRGDAGLTTPRYDLHVISWHKSSATTMRDLFFVNSKDLRLSKEAREILDPLKALRNGDPTKIQDAFDSLERYSVSSVGVRNTFAGTPGTPAYSMFSGSGVDRGLRDGDTSNRALGHAMAQVETDAGTTTAGMSSAKAKYWETRYLSLREHDVFASGLASRYWFPRTAASGPLLPNVARGVRTETFPAGPVLFAEMGPALISGGWRLADGRLVDLLEVDDDPTAPNTPSQLHLVISDPSMSDEVIWRGYQDPEGNFQATESTSDLHKGFGITVPIADALEAFPPTIYFRDGHTVHGGMTYVPVTTQSTLPDITYSPWDWSQTDIQTEAKKPNRSDTVHDEVERRLSAITTPGVQRWVLCNDGKGEIADHIVVEVGGVGRPHVELWHSKFANGPSPAVRVMDLEIVTQQAAKSRRHITDRDFWGRIGRRLTGQESPAISVVAGDVDDLLALCGLDKSREAESIASHPPTMEARIVVVQPGLSIGDLRSKLLIGDQAAGQVREFLTILHSSVQGLGSIEIIGSD